MAKMLSEDRDALAQTRLRNVLRKHGVANARTLEQKISDAGPGPQRIDPHVLSPARQLLIDDGIVRRLPGAGSANWFHLTVTPRAVVDARYAAQLPIWQAIAKQELSMRVGQALEIATYRALLGLPPAAIFFGRFVDLEAHDDATLYSKDEPPRHIGDRTTPGKKCLDFLVQHPTAGFLGIECKNVREWLYPQQAEVKELLLKCLALDCVPVMIARRIPYVTFRLLWTCGCIMHQTFNQLFPKSAQQIADQARHKDLLGYHDIRTGNLPDARLTTFIQKNLLSVADEARQRFDEYKDLLSDYVSGELEYMAFAARVRRREQGLNEDFDDDET
jgi:hypothetical protein